MTIKNRKLQTPLDLCPDPNLCKTLVECYNERRTDDLDLPGNVASDTSTAHHSTVASSSSCLSAGNMTQTFIANNEKLVPGNAPTTLDECLVCSDQKRDTVFKVLFLYIFLEGVLPYCPE